MNPSDEQPHVHHPSLWPIGVAIGIACLLVGLVVSVTALIVGAALTLLFGFLWVRDLFRAHGPVESAAAGVEEVHVGEEVEEIPAYDRSAFLSAATIGIGAVIGAVVTVPVLGFAVLPAFTNQKTKNVDLGPISNFPEGQFVVASFITDHAQGEVSRRTAYIRYNGFTNGQPSFTTVFSRCVHLGCPVQPAGPVLNDKKTTYKDVLLIPTQPAGFSCPCHGGQYDTEGNRTAGPPVRSLDRYEFSIVDGHLVLGKLFSVGEVDGAGANAKIKKYPHYPPGDHVDGPEGWLYPIPVPGS